ncbi:MAG: sodium:solute symporter [Saprospiraceae bacterium]|nr:MAG: sodium:solute symporter [Saprospiraceae bacterium]
MIQQLTPYTILGVIALYFLVLIAISYYTGKKANNEGFFIGNRQSPWIIVAIGMVGATLSGVTFISVPGKVGAEGVNQDFAYMQLVFGYLLGYLVIATILMPLYYRLKLTSIYSFLDQRLGKSAYKMGAAFFLLSRTIQAAFRLYLVAIVLDKFVMEPLGIPFWGTVMATIGLIWVYTFRGGIKTIIWTDTLQTVCMITAVTLTIFSIGNALDANIGEIVDMVHKSEYAQVFFFEGGWSDPNNFFKQFISGALITIVMTGLDQDMMQKNLSCKNIWDAQKNMLTFSIILVFANLLFLCLGALLYIYASNVGLEIPVTTDELFPMIALQNLSPAVGIIFILGLIAAAYSSADSALTALTTSFCVDFLNFEKIARSEEEKQGIRLRVHIGFSFFLFLLILVFRSLNNEAVINQIFIAAGYTYGPLLGLFCFGMFTNLKLREYLDLSNYQITSKLPPALQKINLVAVICLLSPILSFIVDKYSSEVLYGFQFGFLIIALNGLITFVGLLWISYRDYEEQLEAYEPSEQ